MRRHTSLELEIKNYSPYITSGCHHAQAQDKLANILQQEETARIAFEQLPRGPVCLSMLDLARVDPNYVTIILQSSVGTLEGHSEVGVYLVSFCVPN